MNDLLKELDALTPEILEQNELRSNRRKPEWVKVFNEFTADTKITEGQTNDGKPMIILNWSNMNILNSDVPWTGTEDIEEFPVSRNKDGSVRGNSKLGFLIKSLGGKPLTSIDGQKVHYKLNLWQQKNADGTPALNDRGYPKFEVWYWDVVSIAGKGGTANGAKPALSDEEFEAKLPQVVGLDHASAMAAVGEEVISRGIRGKRIKQNEGVYTLVSA
jgi:hypothetical protein